MKSIYDEYAPRNEHEICELFEDLLFMRTDEIMPGELGKEDLKEKEKFTLSDKEKEKLSKSGIINRIFRRWFQINWGWENVSEYFEGETPRQEMAHIYPGINRGKDYFSVNLEKIDNQWKIKPHYYPENFLKQNGGLFQYALKNLREQKDNKVIIEPFFDLEFKEFISWLDFGDDAIKKELKEKDNFGNDYYKYWDLFLRMTSGNIVLNLGIRRLNEDEFSDLCFDIKNCIINFFSSQLEGHKDYLYLDDLHKFLWNTVSRFDNKMISYEEITELTGSDKNISKFKKNENLKRSIELYHNLGVLMDRYIFFPIERYFNGIEQVWTSKEAFLDDLSATMMILKGELKQKDLYLNKNDPEYNNYLDALSPYDLRYLWFVPCTAFRLTGDTFKYFH
ncbi:MAG: hypothetical protein A2360_04840 [Candidatus Staskawiczbacteria bacterium RIFOXYB1_FULL_32_11]|uniref:Uncharacterized protein n=1 Tax=Candidatus Staskawiczbacteria bacterium RIFOXYD1_FULL_32_13 TaxID=1802234 RepID=A0A1G2JL25_9BACT|nr:MAG: hypothetical protein UR22_C0001G0024 [Parcubacteria group bacterium GW2011_GWC2_32_10]OGZ79744.1 MAG: hypothetical protein A2360_04840 [Candidatus Staskawiczbacteria bacterium RIFOXYB1_FULL_32_11]OGZ81037.1 MAG: hypothetical protein A2256_04270 [Candidatus Staskawiczbacteria bacterium RIFOXYA2_FULL_32_7]OGZ87663.1 MAG: hypothetical protein A2561_03120 [Candidatus Staskawiczbacteria bacterium RIFOXYD1_FULL_32_13]